MKKLEVKFENCFGIKNLSDKDDSTKPFVFNFENSNTQLIYAKNGSMKTSFAKIFENYQNEKQKGIKDLIHNEYPVKKEIKKYIYQNFFEKTSKNFVSFLKGVSFLAISKIAVLVSLFFSISL